MDPPTGASGHGTVLAERRDGQSQMSLRKRSGEALTADQQEVIRILAAMDMGHGNRNGPGSLSSTDSRTSNADSDAAVKALAALDQDDRVTPPLLRGLDESHSGLPPTPPTMTSSEVAEAKPARTMSPEPHVFADRVRNALSQSQRSGFSTPVTEAQSPPTPDHSPPSIRETMAVPRPHLIHAYSSFADSFKTANEGLSSRESTSRLQSPIDELSNMNLLGVPQTPEVMTLGSDTGTATQTDTSDSRPVRVKNYQAESDSDFERSTSHGTGDSYEPQISPTIQQALAHPSGYGFQHRLRAPIKPGDDITRLDNALLYGSSNWKPRVTAPPMSKAIDIERDPTPRREIDTEALRNALPVRADSPTLAENITPEVETLLPAESPLSPTQQHSPQIESVPEPISPSTTVADQAILEGNNATYQFIQKENAKRYSAISDGSGVQVVVVATPEHRRTLRHTSKRESLRGDLSLINDSKRNSLDGGSHKLKHKRAMPSLGGDSDDAGSPKFEPEEFYRRSVKPIPFTTTFAPRALQQSDQAVRHGFRSLSGDTGADYLNRKAAPFGSNGTSYAPRRAQTLRRSVRDRSLDRIQSGIVEGMRVRPWSAELTGKATGLGLKAGQPNPVHQLRRTSAEKRLCNLGEVRRTSLGRVDELGAAAELTEDYELKHTERADLTSSRVIQPASQSPALRELRRSSIERRLENNSEIRRASIASEPLTTDLNAASHDEHDRDVEHERRKSSDRTIPISPRRKSFDLRHLHPVETPLSISQFSGTEGELCEATGVSIYPHHNESLLLIHGYGRDVDQVAEDDTLSGAQEPHFQAFLQPPDSPLVEPGQPRQSVDSPLTNPRAAPEPPKLVFIPPTPVDELDRQVGEPHAPVSSSNPRQHLQRRVSLTERVRRYSASLVQPVPFGRSNSLRRRHSHRPQTSPDDRPTHLNPFWQPRNFWEEYSSSDDEDGDWSDDRLPPGGDTSDVQEKRNSFLPRSMSVRLPGFRGRGGFLQGNSLGIDRHGTNSRRHYVTKQVERRRRRTFTLPFTGGTRVEYVGLAAISARVRDARARRQERAAEKRREVLREQIGQPAIHGRAVVPSNQAVTVLSRQ